MRTNVPCIFSVSFENSLIKYACSTYNSYVKKFQRFKRTVCAYIFMFYV